MVAGMWARSDTHLAAAVRLGPLRNGLIPRNGVPRRLIVDLGVRVRVDNRRKGRRDDDALHLGRVRLDGLEDAGGALDRWVEDILDRVLELVVEGRGGVEDIVEGGLRYHGLFVFVVSLSGFGNGRLRLTLSNAPSCAMSGTIT